MRTIETHKGNPANDVLDIAVTDQLGAGGANHRYEITGYNATTNPSFRMEDPESSSGVTIVFQNGQIAEVGVNGITLEVFLAIAADRLDSFQMGPFANEYNAEALLHVARALDALKRRTKERMARGVEGTHTV